MDTTTTPNYQEGWAVGEIENSALVRAIYGLISAVGVAGNLLVCMVMLRVPSLRSNTSDLLVHLAIVDFMVCLWAIPFHLFPHIPSSLPGPVGEIKCRIYTSKFPLWVTMLTSIFNLVTINLERYIAIMYPLKYKKIYRPRNKYLMLLACWLLALLSLWYYFLVYDENNGEGCLFVGWGSTTGQAIAGVYLISAYLLGPLAIMATAQWKVISTLNKQVRHLVKNSQRAGSSQEQNNGRQREMWQLRTAQELQKTLVIVVITYVVCWAPTNIMFLAFNFGVPVNFAAPYYHVGVILGVCNSCLNPVIYTVKNKPFRRGIKTLWFAAWGVTPEGTNNTTVEEVIEMADAPLWQDFQNTATEL